MANKLEGLDMNANYMMAQTRNQSMQEMREEDDEEMPNILNTLRSASCIQTDLNNKLMGGNRKSSNSVKQDRNPYREEGNSFRSYEENKKLSSASNASMDHGHAASDSQG